MSDKERLLYYGYKAHQIIEFPDGTAILDMKQLRQDWDRLKETF